MPVLNLWHKNLCNLWQSAGTHSLTKKIYRYSYRNRKVSILTPGQKTVLALTLLHKKSGTHFLTKKSKLFTLWQSWKCPLSLPKKLKMVIIAYIKPDFTFICWVLSTFFLECVCWNLVQYLIRMIKYLFHNKALCSLAFFSLSTRPTLALLWTRQTNCKHAPPVLQCTHSSTMTEETASFSGTFNYALLLHNRFSNFVFTIVRKTSRKFYIPCCTIQTFMYNVWTRRFYGLFAWHVLKFNTRSFGNTIDPRLQAFFFQNKCYYINNSSFPVLRTKVKTKTSD